MMFPRFNFRGFRGQFLQPVHKSGFTNQVDLQKGAAIFEDETVVMRVEMDPGDRALWDGYLRGSALETFDGRIWVRGTRVPPRPVYGVRNVFHFTTDPRRINRTLRARIYLESFDVPILFAPAAASRLWIDRISLLLNADNSIERWRNDTWRIRYEVESKVPPEKGGAIPYLRDPGEGDERESALQLPVNFSRETFRPLIDKWGKGTLDDAQKVERISEALQSEYTYTLDLRNARGENPLEDFLLRSRRGNCEYFASAMCVLLRQSGVPARVVTGFRAHEWNRRGGYFVVRMKDAHAWVEAYVNGAWRPVDPTPRTFIADESGPDWWRRLQEAGDYLNLRWNRYVLSYDMERQLSFIEKVGRRVQFWSFRGENFAARLEGLFNRESTFKIRAPHVPLPRTVQGGIFVLVVVLGAVLWRRSRPSSSLWFYRKLLRLLKKRGHAKPAGLTLNEFLESLKPALGSAWPDAKLIADCYHEARFGPEPGLSPESEARLRAALHRFTR